MLAEHAAGAAVLSDYATRLFEEAVTVCDQLALRPRPIDAAKPLTPGLASIVVRYFNHKATHMPAWLFIRWRPVAPDSEAHLLRALTAAATRMGWLDRMEALAERARSDASSPAVRDEPHPDTVRFAILLAEAALSVATTAHYLTDGVQPSGGGGFGRHWLRD
jgi:hypothetical protein